jgi:spermidine dehydrogenase
VIYVRGGKAYSVRGTACVLACWNGVIPHLVHELPAAQKLALVYGVKVPLVYTNVALTNWRAWKKLGVGSIQIPNGYFVSARLELDRKDITPDEPAVIKLVRTPCHPGLPSRDQHRAGRTELLTTPFATFETEIKGLFSRMLGPAGFDPRDIAAITVNRWPHGYAYEYNSLWDHFPLGQEPCVIGRAKFGRIAIANADAGAYAYTDCAIEQAKRAVDELL